MAKRVKQLRPGACTIKERHPVASKTDSVWQFVDVVLACSGIYDILVLLNINPSIATKLSSEWPTTPTNKKLQKMLKMKTEGKVAWALRSFDQGGQCNRPNSESSTWETWKTPSEIASTGFPAASNDGKTKCDHFSGFSRGFLIVVGHFLDSFLPGSELHMMGIKLKGTLFGQAA